MKFLYYKKEGSGDLSCLPFKENLQLSKTLAPDGAYDFEVVDLSAGEEPTDPEKDKKIKEKDRQDSKVIRIRKLDNSTVKVGGKVFQTRLSDRALIIDTIDMLGIGETTKWILNNNNVATVSREDLVEVLRLGRLQGKASFDEYIEELEDLGMIE